jgi:ketosteroid isomerase-like protein
LHHPEFEMVTSGTYPGLEPVYKAESGFRQFWNDFQGIWKSLTITVRELVPDGNRVIALWIFEGEGRAGIRVRRNGAHVVTIRDGLVARIEVHGGWDSARDAAKQGS